MNSITEQLLGVVSDWDGSYKGAFNIREDGGCAGRQSSENIKIEPKNDNPGIVIRISSKAQQETVYIPACVTKSGVNDLVYNDFIVEDGADVIIVAGCGVHSEGEEEARHNGIHRFFIGKNHIACLSDEYDGTVITKEEIYMFLTVHNPTGIYILTLMNLGSDFSPTQIEDQVTTDNIFIYDDDNNLIYYSCVIILSPYSNTCTLKL